MLAKLRTFGSMIKFSHTIFALPFALTGAILAFYSYPFVLEKLGWIVLCMVGARTAAMGFNRIIDSDIDAKNPRTTDREIPAGKISKKEATFYVIISIVLFVYSSYQLNLLCFQLSPVALIVVLGYSLTKRFTSLCHIVLGIGLALAPIGAWLAITGVFHVVPVIIGIGVLFWVAGFDIIYASQDYEYDKSVGLHSIPVRLGLHRTLRLAQFFHIIAFACFTAVYFLFVFSPIYLIGLVIIGGIMIYEHRLVQPNDLSKVGMAFFGMNGTISMIYFITVLLDFLLK